MPSKFKQISYLKVIVSFCKKKKKERSKDNKSKLARNILEHETQTPSFLVFGVVNPETTARFSWCFHLLSLSTPHTTTIFSVPPPANDAQFLRCPSLQSIVLHFTRSVSRCREENRFHGTSSRPENRDDQSHA